MSAGRSGDLGALLRGGQLSSDLRSQEAQPEARVSAEPGVVQPRGIEGRAAENRGAESRSTLEPRDLMPATPPPLEQRVNIGLRKSLHRELKLLAVQNETTVQDVLDLAVERYLDQLRG